MTTLPIYCYKPPVLASQIVRIEASINYSKVYFTTHPPLLVAKALQWFESQLLPAGFVRVHRSHLVNPAFVEGNLALCGRQVKLTTGEELPIARRRGIKQLSRMA